MLGDIKGVPFETDNFFSFLSQRIAKTAGLSENKNSINNNKKNIMEAFEVN